MTNDTVISVISDKSELKALLSDDSATIVPQDDSTKDKGGGGTSWYAAAVIVINSALGAGLLAFPSAYSQAGGVLVSSVVQLILIGLIVGSLFILTFCSDTHQAATYQDVVLTTSGLFAKTLCSVCMVLYCFGTCVTFLVIIGDQWDRVMLRVAGTQRAQTVWYLQRRFTMTVSTMVIILPLCFSKRIDFLKYASGFGCIGILYLTFLVPLKYINQPSVATFNDKRNVTWIDVFKAVPTFCYGYQSHISIIPIYSCLRTRTLREFSKTLALAMSVCVTAYTVIGVGGYLTFGDAVRSDILVSYAPGPAVLVAVCLVGAKIYTTYPIFQFCARAAFDSVIVDFIPIANGKDATAWVTVRRNVATIAFFTATLVISIVTPNIGQVVSLLGGLAALFIFVFPGVCLFNVTKFAKLSTARYRFQIGTSLIYFSVGVVLFTVPYILRTMDLDQTENKPVEIVGESQEINRITETVWL